MDGLFGLMYNLGDRVSQGDSLRESPGISGAQGGGQMVRRAASDSRGHMEGPGAVDIGGQRNGVAVFVEVGETQINKAKRTQMRAAGRPQQRWHWGAAGAKNGARFAPRVFESARCD